MQTDALTYYEEVHGQESPLVNLNRAMVALGSILNEQLNWEDEFNVGGSVGSDIMLAIGALLQFAQSKEISLEVEDLVEEVEDAPRSAFEH